MVYSHFSNDQYLIQAFKEDRDVHTERAEMFYNKKGITEEERSFVKAFTFGILYGLGIRGIRRKFKKTEAEAWDMLNTYRKVFSDYISNKVRDDGYIMNPFGRRRSIAEDKSYIALNTLVQGTCGDVLKQAMVSLHNKVLKGTTSHIISTIHDELMVEVSHADQKNGLVPEIKQTMEDFPQFTVPLKVDIKWTKTNWQDKISWKGELK